MNLEVKLSKRELEVAEVMAFTKCKHDAAEKLFISEGTLSAHSFRIYEKLQINSKSELVIWWFVKKLGIELSKIPYFKTTLAIIMSVFVLHEKELYRRGFTRKEDVNNCYLISSK